MKQHMVTKEDFCRLENRFDGLESRFDRLESQFDGLENRFDGLENRFDGLEHEVHELRDYTHKKFILIEHEVIPKISALYEMTDSYVRQAECRKRREKADEKLDCIAPLKAVVKSHSEQLIKHDEVIDKLIIDAG